jgi:hypothetical protein
MTRAQAAGLSGSGILIGGGLLAFLITTVPPWLSDGEPNAAALLMALLSVMLLVGGLGALLALALHNRWPGLAGAPRDGSRPAEPGVALRQGTLLAVGTGFILILVYSGMLDVAFLVVTILMLVLLEAFVQSRT